ncbi:hypothetical protein BCR34DRAFT_604859 [Clohesyomyces aquaticus]|uniref:BHLH domain-containing protein n=1 Tax=Clohesyomyces aquaticus TaxID=1231657 RepID=A0A1Y1Z2Q0_9PLEO|nr:hypothetical protein BCR34DRAFT_604859 [Clohesyomyces aquaticus]
MASKKKRVRVWTPEDRAAHRIFERSRREAFNDSLIELAKQLPSLARTRRLNKHLIVDHSIARHRSQRQLCLAVTRELRGILTERDELLAEVNQWRSASGAPIMPRNAKPMGEQLQRFARLENETFGTFPNGFGENPAANGSSDDHEAHEMANEDSRLQPHPSDELSAQDFFPSHRLLNPSFQPVDICTGEFTDLAVRSTASLNGGVYQGDALTCMDTIHNLSQTYNNISVDYPTGPTTAVQNLLIDTVASTTGHARLPHDIPGLFTPRITGYVQNPNDIFADLRYESLDQPIISNPQEGFYVQGPASRT